MTRRPHTALWGVAAGVAMLAAVAAAALTPSDADACSCVKPPPPAEALRNADAVFVGRAYGQTRIGPTARYSFEVDGLWKGDLPERVEVDTHTQSSACGRTYELGRSYLVYARRSGTQWVDNMCSRTRPSIAASADLAALGDSRKPRQPAVADDPLPISHPPPVEPPRVEPVAAAPAPATPSKRGCAVDPGPAQPTSLWSLLVLLALPRRRRS